MRLTAECRLSAALIVFNEEDRLRRCLDSICEWVDEIVVFDSFSTDTTQQICASYPNIHFYQHVFDGHVEQKNRALDACSGEWVLCLDADEEVSVDLKQAILHFLESDSEAIGADFPRLTSHSGAWIKHGGWYPNRRPRLVKRGCGHWGGENPHDRLIVSGQVEHLQGDLRHHSFADLAAQVATVNQFSSVAALMRYRGGRRFSFFRAVSVPVWKFLEIFVIKRGFLDGMRGLSIAISSSYSAYLKEAKLYELDQLGLDKPSNLDSRYSSE